VNALERRKNKHRFTALLPRFAATLIPFIWRSSTWAYCHGYQVARQSGQPLRQPFPTARALDLPPKGSYVLGHDNRRVSNSLTACKG
jgi:hypothetical protein